MNKRTVVRETMSFLSAIIRKNFKTLASNLCRSVIGKLRLQKKLRLSCFSQFSPWTKLQAYLRWTFFWVIMIWDFRLCGNIKERLLIFAVGQV